MQVARGLRAAMVCGAALVVLAGCGGGRGHSTPADSGGIVLSDGAVDGGGPPVEAQPPGSPCSCDAECQGDATHAGICVFGVCMTRSAGDCSAAGSTAECIAGSRCWGLEGFEGGLCWPDCSTYPACAGECDGDGSCAPTASGTCNPACGTLCGDDPGPCAPENPMGTCAGADQVCLDGTCVDACSPTNPTGFCPTGSSCMSGTCVSTSGCPTWMCTGPTCSDIIAMPGSTSATTTEAMLDGYYVSHEPRYSFLRRDLTMLVQYAACEVANRYPGTRPLATGDLTQADGMTPGSDTGDLRHPAGTHTGGDMDLAYYQNDSDPNLRNDLQIICGDGTDTNYNGRPGVYNDGYFCTTDMNIVDWPRQAYFFAMMASTPLVRVFGVDETIADDFEREINALYTAGEITSAQATQALYLGYGADGGWAFHHHHTHMSFDWP